MKFISIVKKTFKEQFRDYTSVILTLVSAPFFVLLYYLMSGGSSTSYNVFIMNADKGPKGKEVVEAVKQLSYKNGDKMLKVTAVTDTAFARKKLADKAASLMLIIPENFSEKVTSPTFTKDSIKVAVTLVGDMTNPTYSVAAIFTFSAVEEYLMNIAKTQPLYDFKEEFIGSSGTRTEFETYVPGLLVFAVIMILYTAAISVIKEVEDKTLIRLQLSSVSTFKLLAGISTVQIFLGITAVILALCTAMLLGFTSTGPVFAVLVISILTTFSIVAISLIVVGFAKNVNQILTIGTFPLFLLMWFTGALYPIPKTNLFTIAGYTVTLNDLLPPTQSVLAMNKILTYGSGLGGVMREIAFLIVLTIIYFVLGVKVFQKKKMGL